MKVLLSLCILFFSLSSLTRVENDSNENKTTIYVAKNLSIYQNKYAILEIKDSLAHLEVYAKFNGNFVPVNMAWNSKIDPVKYILKKDSADLTTQIFRGHIIDITVKENEAFVNLKGSFMGAFALSFDRVASLPSKYESVKNHAYMFTGRNAIGYQFKDEGGFASYDRIMKGHFLYEKCDKLNFDDFVAQYDSVQKIIYRKIYSIHDSLKMRAAMDDTIAVEQ